MKKIIVTLLACTLLLTFPTAAFAQQELVKSPAKVSWPYVHPDEEGTPQVEGELSPARKQLIGMADVVVKGTAGKTVEDEDYFIYSDFLITEVYQGKPDLLGQTIQARQFYAGDTEPLEDGAGYVLMLVHYVNPDIYDIISPYQGYYRVTESGLVGREDNPITMTEEDFRLYRKLLPAYSLSCWGRENGVGWETQDEAAAKAFLAAIGDVHKKGVTWNRKANYYIVDVGEKGVTASYRICLDAAGEGTAYVRGPAPDYERWEVKSRSVPFLEKLLRNGPDAIGESGGEQ